MPPERTSEVFKLGGKPKSLIGKGLSLAKKGGENLIDWFKTDLGLQHGTREERQEWKNRDIISAQKKRTSSENKKLSNVLGDAEAATPVLSDRDFMRSFKIGDKNQIAALQQRLVDAGYDIGSSGPGGQGIDAMFGRKTQAAYRDWAAGVMEAEGEEAYRYETQEDLIMNEMTEEPENIRDLVRAIKGGAESGDIRKRVPGLMDGGNVTYNR